MSRTATFTFCLGDRYYGVITAAVLGPQAAQYRFTSALPLAVMKILAPSFEHELRPRGAPEGIQLVDTRPKSAPADTTAVRVASEPLRPSTLAAPSPPAPRIAPRKSAPSGHHRDDTDGPDRDPGSSSPGRWI